MEKTNNKCLQYASCIFGLYLAIHYWDPLILFIGRILHAMTPLILGGVFAYILNILMTFYEKNFPKKAKWAKKSQKYKRPIAVFLAFLTLLGIIGLLIGVVLPEVIQCIEQLAEDLPPIIEAWWNGLLKNEDFMFYAADFMEKLPSYEEIEKQITQNTQTIISGMSSVIGSVFGVVTNIVTAIVTLVIALVFAVHILLSKDKIKMAAKQLLATYLPQKKEKILKVWHVLNDSFHSFISGQCLDVTILGIMVTIGMAIFRFPYPIMVGALIGVTAVVPIAGSYFGAIVGAFLMLTESPMTSLLFIILIIVIQQIDGNFIYPKIVGDQVGLPPMLVLAAVTIGGGLFGIVGILVMIPLFSTVFILVKMDIEEKRKKEITNKQEKYTRQQGNVDKNKKKKS